MKDRRPNKPKRRFPPRPNLPRPLKPTGPHSPPTAAPGEHAPTPPATGGPPTDWSKAAAWYDQLVGEAGSEYHREVVLPGTVRLLAAKSGEPVLDIACGQGVLCRILARQGIPTTGVDAAEDLIRLARDRNAQLNQSAVGSGQSAVKTSQPPTSPPATGPSSLPTADCPLPTYHTHDVRDLSFLPENHFVAAACVLAIQNISSIGPVFASVARVLRPGGRFVVVMMHPAFRNPKETHWGWDDRAMVQYRRVDKYLTPRKIPIVTNPGKGPDYTWTFHKPIEAYVKTARSANLLIDALEEWPSHKTSTSGPRAPAENTARKEIPMFLALRAIKITGLTAQDPTGPEFVDPSA